MCVCAAYRRKHTNARVYEVWHSRWRLSIPLMLIKNNQWCVWKKIFFAWDPQLAVVVSKKKKKKQISYIVVSTTIYLHPSVYCRLAVFIASPKKKQSLPRQYAFRPNYEYNRQSCNLHDNKNLFLFFFFFVDYNELAPLQTTELGARRPCTRTHKSLQRLKFAYVFIFRQTANRIVIGTIWA